MTVGWVWVRTRCGALAEQVPLFVRSGECSEDQGAETTARVKGELDRVAAGRQVQGDWGGPGGAGLLELGGQRAPHAVDRRVLVQVDEGGAVGAAALDAEVAGR